ncbi:SET domain-containing protein-lysine N-methyltransferase [Pedococcus sp. NPDC057267]|uniref:SET domain-containing protein-lysine N-methyltransferase n=1 Tax=Pedococcus sp. NPDC057267 TaxID=3346077 RepID=UPI00362C60A4
MPVERRPSAIAGRGLFTTQPLPTGTVVEVEAALLNHSCDPTLAWAGARLVAFRDVAEGEELTVDYATSTTDPDLLVRCHCETYRCRQMVTGEDWRIPELQRRYAGHLATEVQAAVDAEAGPGSQATRRGS